MDLRRPVLLLAASFAAVAVPLLAQGDFVLRDATLIDGTGAPARTHMTVVVRGDTIAAVQPDAAAMPKGLRIDDLRGATVMPGLISAHSHVGLLEANATNSATAYTRENVLAALAQYERYGVTTIVSLGLNRDLVYELRAEVRSGHVPGATLLTAGRGVGVPGGAPPIPTQDDQVYRPATAAEARQDVDDMAAHHVDVVKVWVDPLHGTKPEMQPGVYAAVIAEAHAQHLHVAAHEYALADARRLVMDGVDVLGHSVRDQPVDAGFAQQMLAHGTWYIPTFTVDESAFRYAEQPEFMKTRFFREAAGPALLAKFDAPGYAAKIEADPQTAQHRQDFAMDGANLKTIFAAGVKVAFGTDSGAAPGRVPGFSEHRELEDMVDAGLTPMQVLTLATGRTGDLIHELDPTLRVGRIAPGYSADMVVLAADPLTDIRNTRRISAIYHRGRTVEHPAPQD